jgi:DNA (cytosine-5)-methyltransferase 1
MAPRNSDITATDMFAGAGGTTTGATHAGVRVVMASNHWRLAVDSHQANYPETDHDCADINQVDPRRYPSTDVLLASPSCTNHSLAKGARRKNLNQLDLWGKSGIDPAEERSRATMWDVVRFAEFHEYRIIIVENVVDVRLWALFDSWLTAMHALGYAHECVYFNSMFAHPTPQSRDRIYIVFWRKGNKKPNLHFTPEAHCPKCDARVGAVQAWKNMDKQFGRYGRRNQYVYVCPKCQSEVTPFYYAAASAIDWRNLGERIGDREKPLKDKTMARIRYGLEKFGGSSCVFNTDYGKIESGRAKPITDAMMTQTSRQTVAMYTPGFIVSQYNGRPAVRSTEETFPTIPGMAVHRICTPPQPQPFIVEYWGNSTASPVSDALSTLVGVNHHGFVSPFLTSYYGTENARPVTDAVATVTTKDRHALVQPDQPLEPEDCYFRMLTAAEVQKAMAFPDDYIVLGTARQRVKQLGNAVTPPVMEMLVERCVATFK